MFEITETAMIEETGVAVTLAERLRTLGCRFALDDFGSGYGGFHYLKHLPMDFLKIDREFIRDMRTSDADQHVIRAIVGLAQGFGLKTIAEGVEDQETLEMLREFGVDHAQGFLVGRPALLPPSPLRHSAPDACYKSPSRTPRPDPERQADSALSRDSGGRNEQRAQSRRRGQMDGDGDGEATARSWTADASWCGPTARAAAEISRAIVQLMARSAGRGPTKARTTLDAGHALVVVEDALTTGERGLVAAGEPAWCGGSAPRCRA